jgi:hypothetical protein
MVLSINCASGECAPTGAFAGREVYGSGDSVCRREFAFYSTHALPEGAKLMTPSNNSLDWSGGSVFRIIRGAAKVECRRSTLTFDSI